MNWLASLSSWQFPEGRRVADVNLILCCRGVNAVSTVWHKYSKNFSRIFIAWVCATSQVSALSQICQSVQLIDVAAVFFTLAALTASNTASWVSNSGRTIPPGAPGPYTALNGIP